jgi:catechol 2,3-dioxygenase-like lactoylglutathione lyase family enzyme
MNIIGQYHTGFVVANLEKSLHFYVDILGLKIERKPTTQTGKWISDVVGLKNAVLKMVHLGTGDGHSIELIEYVSHAKKNSRQPDEVYALRSAHCAFVVEDLLGWYKKLKENSIEIISNGEPSLRDKPYPWSKYGLYLRDPDGNVIEMVERDPKPEGSSEN